MAATTTVETDERAAPATTARQPTQAPPAARSAEQTVARGDTAGAGAGAAPAGEAGERETSQGSYSLLTPPDYDGIVGGVPPSPFASALLLLGLVCLIVGAAGAALGNTMTEWWIVGAMLVAIAAFLAAFVSRSA